MKTKKSKIICYFDGCCEPVNPGGHASYGAVVFDDGIRIWECSELFKPVKGKERETSNNVAEYSGFIAILEYLLSVNQQHNDILVYGDSKLVIEQMMGNWRIVKGFYKPLAYKAKHLVKQFKKLKLEWIPRDLNDIADELSKAELKKAGVKFMLQPED